jgi:hypothetical protein
MLCSGPFRMIQLAANMQRNSLPNAKANERLLTTSVKNLKRRLARRLLSWRVSGVQ